MSLQDILYWISLAILWVCIGLNVRCIIRSRRFSREWDRILDESQTRLQECDLLRNQWLERIKELEQKEALLEAEGKYCNTMIAACTEFLEATNTSEIENRKDQSL